MTSEEKNELIKEQIKSSIVTFSVSSHMLKNSEMNATKPIREFLQREQIIDFNEINQGDKDYKEGVVLFKGERISCKVRFGSPPHKYESRFWIE